MKTLIKLASLGALAYVAFEIYQRRQRYDVQLPGTESEPANSDMVADTNSVATGDPQQEQLAPQPQDWRGAQNVIGS